MATNSFSALMAEVNQVIAEASQATSTAKGAAIQAQDATQKANASATGADDAARDAAAAAEAAAAETDKWEGMTVSARTLEPGEEATVTLREQDGVKHLEFALPRGRDGKEGAKGDPGKSGVEFTLSGTTLYITTDS